MIESETILNAESSTDPDGSIVAWFWNIGDSTYSGPIISHVFEIGNTEVNLTVLDENGGIDFLVVDIEAVRGSTISDLVVSKDGSSIDLSWSWSGSDTEFYVWRSSSPIENRNDLSMATLIATTNQTAFKDPIFLAGTHYYSVTVDIDGIENQFISNENLGSLELTNEDIVLIEVEENTVGTILVISWIILSLLISVGIGIRRRFN